jgi:hypothetical protein
LRGTEERRGQIKCLITDLSVWKFEQEYTYLISAPKFKTFFRTDLFSTAHNQMQSFRLQHLLYDQPVLTFKPSVCTLSIRCTYVVHTILRQNPEYFVNRVNRFVFKREKTCVLSKVGNVFLCRLISYMKELNLFPSKINGRHISNSASNRK